VGWGDRRAKCLDFAHGTAAWAIELRLTAPAPGRSHQGIGDRGAGGSATTQERCENRVCMPLSSQLAYAYSTGKNLSKRAGRAARAVL